MTAATNLTALSALSPLDGRYAPQLHELAQLFSEAALIKRRVEVEIYYLLFLAAEKLIPPFTQRQQRQLAKIMADFSPTEAALVKNYEAKTKHDVKAVEYYLRQQMRSLKIPGSEFLHLALTSEDINSLAYALMLQTAQQQVLLPELKKLLRQLSTMAAVNAKLPMLARTHGQAALPTTLGKELAVFAARLLSEIKLLEQVKIEAKLNGAVGNFNAQQLAWPQADWPKLSQKFIQQFGLQPQLISTQILSAESYNHFFQTLFNINQICLNFSQDMWRYISDDYLLQQASKTQVGSSTMPQKINPIDFENAEGNLGLANSLLQFFFSKLAVSRLQRDLSDSTVKRNFGVALAYSLLAYRSLQRGLSKITPHLQLLKQTLDQHWEILAEALQVSLRLHGHSDAYEQLRQLTQGKKVTAQSLQQFIKKTSLPAATKKQLLQLTPQNYLGLAPQLTELVTTEINNYLQESQND